MNLVTENLRLVPCSVEMLQSLIDDAIDLNELIGVQVPKGWPAEELKEVAPYFIKLLSQSPEIEGKLCWFIVEKEQNIVIGSMWMMTFDDAYVDSTIIEADGGGITVIGKFSTARRVCTP